MAETQPTVWWWTTIHPTGRPERAFHTHGGGIAVSRELCFDSLEYSEKGNEVRAVKKGSGS